MSVWMGYQTGGSDGEEGMHGCLEGEGEDGGWMDGDLNTKRDPVARRWVVQKGMARRNDMIIIVGGCRCRPVRSGLSNKNARLFSHPSPQILAYHFSISNPPLFFPLSHEIVMSKRSHTQLNTSTDPDGQPLQKTRLSGVRRHSLTDDMGEFEDAWEDEIEQEEELIQNPTIDPDGLSAPLPRAQERLMVILQPPFRYAGRRGGCNGNNS